MKSIILFLLSFVITFIIFNHPAANIVKKTAGDEEKFSGAMQSLDFWTAQRAYPNKNIPDNAYYKAYASMQDKLNKTTLVTAQWEELGPQNIGGRTLALDLNPLNPNTIYAGSASGGLWRSYTGGVGVKAWNYIPIGYPVLSVGAIAINPQDTNVIYIGTGEVYGYQNSIGGLNIRTTRGSYGIGLLKTTDNGLTWNKSIDWSYNQTRGVEVIRIDPSNSNTVFAGTTEGIFKTTDAGTSWNQIHNVIMTTDILVNKQNSQIILEACGNLNSTGAGIYRSTNGGSSWTKITTNIPIFGGKILLAGFAGNANVCFASVGMGTVDNAGTQLLRSTDFGATWSLLNSADYSTYQGWYSHFVIPHPTDASKILCAGIDIYKSTNGGSTLTIKSDWSAWYFGVPPIGGPEGPNYYSHADHHAYVINPLNPNMVYFGNDGGVFRTTDFGETFQGCNGGYQTTQFYKRIGVSKTDSTRLIGGLQDNATAVWEGTLAWRRGIGGDGCCTQISPTRTDTMYGSAQYLYLNRSTDKGVTWNYIAPNSSNEAFNAPFLLAPSNPKIIYAAGDHVYKSTNAGNSWITSNGGSSINGDPVLSIAVSYSNPDSVYLTTAPTNFPVGVFRSVNGGGAWTDITSNLPDRYPVDISVDPRNSSIVYVVFSGFGTSHLFRSTNGGNSWTDIGQELPDVPTSAVCIDPFNSSTLYVGNDLGVFYSTDNGTSWKDLNSCLIGTALVMDLAVSPIDKKLIVATHGRGVYRISLSSITSVGISNNSIPEGFALLQNYPNPFNGETVIKYSIPATGYTSLVLYDITGKEIKVLVSGNITAGMHSAVISRNDFARLTSGVYLYKLTTIGYSSVKKMVILK
jgi:photosystem II stability/assembly factor-like uncharacterized protein